LFKYLPPLIPSERLTPEAKFKTVLAMLLAQEEIRDFFLSDRKRQNDFYQALIDAASSSGYSSFIAPTSDIADTPLKISRQLTLLSTKKISLIDDMVELNLQMAALKYPERCEILFKILNKIERPPITSVIEITSPESTESIHLTTKYAKYKITYYDEPSGQIGYTYAENQATSSIKTLHNFVPDAKGTMTQRIVFDAETNDWISSYCGELSTPFHVLEQILLILGQTKSEAQFIKPINDTDFKEIKILFTSLYSWDEIDLIVDQKAAIRQWDQKILKSGNEYFKLDLTYFNISFNALNKYPSPAEIKASIQDINDEACITLLAESWKHLGLASEELANIAAQTLFLRKLNESNFLEREQALLKEIDHFRRLKSILTHQIDSLACTDFNQAIKALLCEKRPDGKALKGIDKLLYLDYISKHLGYFHNKNCQNATDRSAGANAADKGKHAYQKMYKSPFLPGYKQEDEKALYKVLYSMYLVWEEPEINTWLSTGFVGEKFYNNFFQKNPETTRYLICWLKKHPEMYLGLSDYRT